jgi:hypothetical protein
MVGGFRRDGAEGPIDRLGGGVEIFGRHAGRLGACAQLAVALRCGARVVRALHDVIRRLGGGCAEPRQRVHQALGGERHDPERADHQRRIRRQPAQQPARLPGHAAERRKPLRRLQGVAANRRQRRARGGGGGLDRVTERAAGVARLAQPIRRRLAGAGRIVADRLERVFRRLGRVGKLFDRLLALVTERLQLFLDLLAALERDFGGDDFSGHQSTFRFCSNRAGNSSAACWIVS